MNRSASVVKKPGGPGGAPGVVALTVGDRTAYYLVRELECQPGERGWAVWKLGAGELHHVRVEAGSGFRYCDCVSGLAQGRCRHADSFAALARAGHL